MAISLAAEVRPGIWASLRQKSGNVTRFGCAGGRNEEMGSFGLTAIKGLCCRVLLSSSFTLICTHCSQGGNTIYSFTDIKPK